MKPGNLQDQTAKVPIPTDSKRIWKIRGGACSFSPLLKRRGLFCIPFSFPLISLKWIFNWNESFLRIK
jgi:hypothetical protein